jgi:integrase
MNTILDSYALWWRGTNRSAATLQNYVYALERLAVRLGGPAKLRDATIDDLRAYQADRLAATSPGTASVDFRAIRSFYGWLLDEEEIDRNPAAKLRGPDVPETPVKVATETDVKRLLARCPRSTDAGRRDAAIIALLWATGARRGEISRLDVEHFDAEYGWMTIGKTKNGTPRRVPLDVDALAALDRWLRRRGYEPGPLFKSEHGRRLTPNGIGQMLARRCDEAGVDVSAHQFRRALAERWLRAGGGETQLRSVVGWKPGSPMVARYTRMAAEELAHVEYRRLFG